MVTAVHRLRIRKQDVDVLTAHAITPRPGLEYSATSFSILPLQPPAPPPGRGTRDTWWVFVGYLSDAPKHRVLEHAKEA